MSIIKDAKEWPKVSVIVPAYNASRFILEALDTVMQQRYQPLEVLLVDDGSVDNTVSLVQSRFPSVRIISQPNAGVAAARNSGLKVASGEFICFLDADDGWYPGKLHAQAAHLLAHPDVGAVYHSWQVWEPDKGGRYPGLPVDQNVKSDEIDADKSGWIYPKLLMDCIVHTSTIMIRRGLIELVGQFRSDLMSGEDYDYWLRLSRQAKIDKLTTVYSFYRISTGSLTSRIMPINYEYLVISSALKKWGRFSPDGMEVPRRIVEKRLGKLAFEFAYSQFRLGSSKLVRKSAIQAVRHDPRQVKALLFYIGSFFRCARRNMR